MQLPIDSGTLKSGAIGYHIFSTLYDIAVCAVILGIVSIIRRFVAKKSNSRPSGLWYVPKVLGMLFIVLSALHFVANGAFVNGIGGGPLFLIFTLAVAAGLLYWGYRVIWKPIYRKA